MMEKFSYEDRISRWTRVLLVVLPLLLITSGLLRLTHARDTSDDCPPIAGTMNCGDGCSFAGKFYARDECAHSRPQGCCKYKGYNVHCNPNPAPNLCPNKYFMELVGSEPDK
jgi:hypothetical protein